MNMNMNINDSFNLSSKKDLNLYLLVSYVVYIYFKYVF